MNEKTGRGYDLPLTKQKWRFWILLMLVPAFLYQLWEMGGEFDWIFLVVFMPLWMTVQAEFVNCFGKLHLVPEGIAITLFGKTVRRLPREQFRFLGGISYRYKNQTYSFLCVCTQSMEALAEEQERKTPKMLRNARTRPRWTENMVETLLRGYVRSARFMMGFHRKDIVPIEWSAERLGLFQRMYPEVPWADLTEKQILSQ